MYGRAKLAGERFVREIAPESFVVRVGYVYGGGNDYLSRTVRRLAAGEPVGGLADRWGSPTFVGHLADRILPLVLTGRFGLYHLGGPQPASWYEVLTRVHGLIGLPVEPQHAADLGLPAPRVPYSALRACSRPTSASIRCLRWMKASRTSWPTHSRPRSLPARARGGADGPPYDRAFDPAPVHAGSRAPRRRVAGAVGRRLGREGGRVLRHRLGSALGGTHVLLEVGGAIVSHASVVERILESGEHPMRTGYVEAVATRPSSRGTAMRPK